MNDRQMSLQIKAKAYETGYEQCGIMKVQSFKEFEAALDERSGAYEKSKLLYDNLRTFIHPNSLYEWAKSIIVCTIRYGKYKIPGNIDKYIGKMYLFDSRVDECEENNYGFHFESFLKKLGLKTVKNKVPQRWAAVKSGVGRFGRNNFLYTDSGSWIVIESWIVDSRLQYDEPSRDIICPQSCRKCIDACPTGALSAPFMMDMGKCIAYLSYRLKELPSKDLRDQMGCWIYGCDVCQDVCPINKGKLEQKDDFPGLSELAYDLTPQGILDMNLQTLEEKIYPRFWYINKDYLWVWKSNALRAMANNFKENYIPYIEKAMKCSDKNIKNMAMWAYEKIKRYW